MKKACESQNKPFRGLKYTVFNISAKDEGIEICQLHIYSNLEQNPTILFILNSGKLIKFEFSESNTQNIQLMQAIVLVLSDVQGILKSVKNVSFAQSIEEIFNIKGDVIFEELLDHINNNNLPRIQPQIQTRIQTQIQTRIQPQIQPQTQIPTEFDSIIDPTEFPVVTPFVYVKSIDIQSLYTMSPNKDTFSTSFTHLLQVLNNIPNYNDEMYKDIFVKNIDILTCIKNAKRKLVPIVIPSQGPPGTPQGVGGRRSKPKSYTKTADKFKYNNRNYDVYMGTRSGLYIKLNGGYKSVKSIA